MSNNTKKTGPFDVKTVEALVALMAANDLSEVYLRDGNQHVRLRRGTAAPVLVPAAVPMAATLSPAAPSPSAAADSAAPAAPKKNLLDIKSESVGTFYSQAKPGEPPFVKVGDRVTPGKVIGVLEVMKTYNDITANCTGVIAEILVENAKYVEFNEVLFRVDPA